MLRLLLIPAGLLLAAAAPEAPAPRKTSCTTCHLNADLFGADLVRQWEGTGDDVHHEVGLSCHDCHGGNPDPALGEDAVAAMDAGFAANPFRGAPPRGEIPAFCGGCHSDPVYMKTFRPDPRIDQETEYRTSRHGIALRGGDLNVATCVDCHGVHRILRPGHAESPVFPANVAATCGHCHSDPERMKAYRLADGRPLPVDQEARWSRSVHADAMVRKGDLSAPTCNDCHGNHGATPPGLETVANVCGQCHGREAALFRESPKKPGLQRHNEFLADAGAEGCAGCHGESEPQAARTAVHPFTECVTCHENHGVVRPTIALLSPLPETPCAFCHGSPEVEGGSAVEPARVREHYARVRDDLLRESADLEPEERHDWLVDRALALPAHTLPADEGTDRILRPEFARLFERFRIGKTHYTYVDPASGGEVKARVVRCSDCHGETPELAAAPVGWRTARDYVSRMQALTVRVGQAERVLLAARRGGVEVKDALTEIDKAVDSQIELEVLVHRFDAVEGGAFAAKQAEGLTHADAALAAGREALRELRSRRTGLGLSLVFITLTLVGLGIRIRRLPE